MSFTSYIKKKKKINKVNKKDKKIIYIYIYINLLIITKTRLNGTSCVYLISSWTIINTIVLAQIIRVGTFTTFG